MLYFLIIRLKLKEKILEDFFRRAVIPYSTPDQVFIIIFPSLQMDQSSGVFSLSFQLLQTLGKSEVSGKDTLIQRFVGANEIILY